MATRLHLASPATAAGSSAQPEPAINVILGDDHAAVRRSLRLLLDGEHDVNVVAEASDLTTAVRRVQEQRPRVLVLDLKLPNGSSIEAIRRLRANVPETEIVVLTMEHSPLFAKQALDAGAVGFVLKDKSDDELPTAVRLAARGEEFVSSHVAAGLEALRTAAGDGLSSRETEVLRLIALGHTSAEIGRKMHLSRRTIESHRARIFSKLGLATRAELVGYALRHHLIGD